jgi:hypothetical protein
LTQGNEINARGQIVGVYFGADEVWHGYLLSVASFTSIDFPGSTGTGPYGSTRQVRLRASILTLTDRLTVLSPNHYRHANRNEGKNGGTFARFTIYFAH